MEKAKAKGTKIADEPCGLANAFPATFHKAAASKGLTGPMDHNRFSVQSAWQILLIILTAGLLMYTFTPGKSFGGGGAMKPEAKRKAMPDFTLPDLSGTKWNLSSHRGNVVLLNFWATWCPPCRRETPYLVSLSNAYRNLGLDVTGISMDEGGMAATGPFAAEYHIPYPILLPASDFHLARAMDGLPTTLLIDRQGRMAKAYVGEVNERTLRSDIERLLGEGSRNQKPPLESNK